MGKNRFIMLIFLFNLLFLVGCGTTYNLEVDAIDISKYPQVLMTVSINGKELPELGVRDFEIVENDINKFPEKIKSLEDGKYEVIYESSIENTGELKVPLILKVNISDNLYSVSDEFITPVLPEYLAEIEEVDVNEYPLIQFRLKLMDSDGKLLDTKMPFKATQLSIMENGKAVTADNIEKNAEGEYLVTYQTSNMERLKKTYHFNVDLDLEGQKVSCEGEFIPPALNNLDINLEQVDTHDFPTVKLYYSIMNQDTGLTPIGLMKDFFYLYEMADGTEGLSKQDILKVSQLNEEEALNINMVADVSGSMMEDDRIGKAKTTISEFIRTVQFDAGDKVELIAFSDGVYPIVDFTEDASLLISEAQNLEMGNMTCVYDALFAAINRTASQKGAKCIIAFTDGQDNISYNTKDSVIELANRYGIPIFIIGVGSDLEEDSLQEIANKTSGFYRNIYDVSDMQEIYDAIYRQQKELYVVEYAIDKDQNPQTTRRVQLEIQNNEFGGMCEIDYTPKLLIDINSQMTGMSEIDDIIGEYLRGFVKGINANDFSYLKHTLEPGSELYKTQEKYVTTQKVKEQLISYEIIEKDYDNQDRCKVKVREIYQIENYKEPLHIKVFENVYSLRQQSNGGWLLISLDELKVVGKTDK